MECTRLCRVQKYKVAAICTIAESSRNNPVAGIIDQQQQGIMGIQLATQRNLHRRNGHLQKSVLWEWRSLPDRWTESQTTAQLSDG